MHQAAFDWVAQHAPTSATTVIEVGSRDVNGSIRPIFGFCDNYVGIDLAPGPGVDVVADFTAWTDSLRADCVVCCEVLEHAEDWRLLVAHMADHVTADGCVILTAATDPRQPHSAIDGGVLRPGEHYGNLDPEELAAVLDELFVDVTIDVTADGDVRAVAKGLR